MQKLGEDEICLGKRIRLILTEEQEKSFGGLVGLLGGHTIFSCTKLKPYMNMRKGKLQVENC